MAKITIIIQDKKDSPHYQFREEKLNFNLDDGHGIIDAHNVLVDMAIKLGEEVAERKKQQQHINAIYLFEEEKINGKTIKEFHESKECSCYWSKQLSPLDCIYKLWKEEKITDRQAIVQMSY